MTAIRTNVRITDDHRLRLDIGLPPDVPTGEAEVTLLVAPQGQPNKAKAIECLRELARHGGVRSIPDPSAWQREVRRDRPLPDRE
ncbi:MAG: hypothetical protein ABSE73_00245 [Planctomycetota bacterium]